MRGFLSGRTRVPEVRGSPPGTFQLTTPLRRLPRPPFTWITQPGAGLARQRRDEPPGKLSRIDRQPHRISTVEGLAARISSLLSGPAAALVPAMSSLEPRCRYDDLV